MTEDTPPPPHPCSIGERNPSARFAGTSPFRGGFHALQSSNPKTCEARPPPPHLPSHKHRPIVENGTFSTGPFVRNRREPRSGRPCEAPPTQDICLRGVRGPARRMETSPAPGSLWFLSPAGQELVRPQTHETPSSHILIPARVPPSPSSSPPRRHKKDPARSYSYRAFPH